MFGYSFKFASDVLTRHKKKPSDPLLELGALCIKYDIPMSYAAKELEVSRQAIYDWFKNAYHPSPEMLEKITKLNTGIKKTHKKA